MKSVAVLLATALCAIAVTGPRGVAAHGAITAAVGANGQEGRALGIDPNTPRNGTKKTPFQQDSSIIRDREIQAGKTGPCGRTLAGGNNDMESGTAAIMAAMGGLPMVMPGKEFTMTLHQVNADGAGPYSCDMSSDGGKTFQKVQVTKNVPGVASLSLTGSKKDMPLNVMIPQSAQCAGGADGNQCMIRCRNPAAAGPFGGCVPVMMATAGAGNDATGAGNAAGGAATGGAAQGAKKAAGGAGAAAGKKKTPAAGGAATGAGAGDATGAATGAATGTTKAAGGARKAAGAGALAGLLGL